MKSKNKDVGIIACQPIVPKAMRAGLDLEYGERNHQIKCINLRTMKRMEAGRDYCAVPTKLSVIVTPPEPPDRRVGLALSGFLQKPRL